MAENQLPLIIPETAENARFELLSALQSADNPSGWMAFMEAVTRLLPDILSSGRPSTDAIMLSPIGQLGFKSWKEMIEAPVDAHGLGWNFHGWKEWRRSWGVVLENPWLRDHPFGSSEIKTWATAFDPFPDSLEALQALLKDKMAATEQKRVDALKEAQRALGEANGKIALLTDQLGVERAANARLLNDSGRLEAEIARLKDEINRVSSTQNLTRWQHFVAAFKP